MEICLIAGEPLFVGMDLTIASFDAISEVNMVGNVRFFRLYVGTVCGPGRKNVRWSESIARGRNLAR